MILNVIKDAMVHGYIELTHVHLYPEVAPILAEALVQMPLFVLTMQDTVFREPVVAMMSHVLTCSETLECLDLSGCRFSATGTVNSFRQISDAMKRSKLRRLCLHADLSKASAWAHQPPELGSLAPVLAPVRFRVGK